MNRLASSFVLGYHGCDEDKADKFLKDHTTMNPSTNKYDWLGSGIYFWEGNPLRGLQWAEERSRDTGSTIKRPYVVGAVIDLGLCLDLTTSDAIKWIETAHVSLVDTFRIASMPLPKNTKNLQNNLDCAVVEMLHDIRKSEGKPEIQTVRGVFTEGAPIYPTSAFRAKTHVQIAVRDHACIKGLFRVPKEHLA